MSVSNFRGVFFILFLFSAFAVGAVEGRPLKIIIDQNTTQQELKMLQEEMQERGYVLEFQELEFSEEAGWNPFPAALRRASKVSLFPRKTWWGKL